MAEFAIVIKKWIKLFAENEHSSSKPILQKSWAQSANDLCLGLEC